MEHKDFLSKVKEGWNLPVRHMDIAKTITAKLKNLRRIIKDSATQFSTYARTIDNTNILLNFMDCIEEGRDLTIEEWNFRAILKNHVESLLNQQKIYWK